MIKIKKNLIQKARVKKSYAKLKSREPPIDKPIPDQDNESEASWKPKAETEAEPSQELHPDRQAMLDKSRSPTPNEDHASFPGREKQIRNREPRKTRKPKYFEKEISIAENSRAEAAARREEFERNLAEKKRKTEERDRSRKAMAKARTGGKNGQRKLGRESGVLLEKVKRLVEGKK